MRLLVIRTSAMGDVALTVPVIRMMIKENPDLEITLVTNELYKPLFNSIERLNFICPRFKEEHKGIKGLYKFIFHVTKEHKYDAIIDLHSVIRSRIIRFWFRIKGVSIYSINKGRSEKQSLLKRTSFTRLKHSTQRYIDVFKKCGLKTGDLELPALATLERTTRHLDTFLEKMNIKKSEDEKWIGIAPFAKHDTKIWPTDNFYKLIDLLDNERKVKIFLFGGGESEMIKLTALAKSNKNVINVAGKITLNQEIALMKRLDFMITMDSANMHIAALAGIKVISIWGGTHPYLGFYAIGQRPEYEIQLPIHDVKCRPCSVYGSKPCSVKGFPCMNKITPRHVYERLETYGLLD